MYLASNMGLQYLTLMRRILENKKKLTSIRLMNSADMNSKNIVNNVGVFIDKAAMNTFFRA